VQIVGLIVDCRCWLSFATLGCWLSSVFCRVSVVDCRCWLLLAIVCRWFSSVGCLVSLVDCRSWLSSLLLFAGCHRSVVGYRLLTGGVNCRSLLLVAGCHLVGCRVSVVDCRCRLSFAISDCWLPSVGCLVSFIDGFRCWSPCHVSVAGYRLLIVGVDSR
jgi:hypothetical protein